MSLDKGYIPPFNHNQKTPSPSPSKYNKPGASPREGYVMTMLRRFSFLQLLAIASIFYMCLAVVSIQISARVSPPLNYYYNPNLSASFSKDGYYALAVAQGGSVDRTIAFVLSWARHAPYTRLVIFTDPTLLQDERVARIYRELKVIAIPFSPPHIQTDPNDPEDFEHVGNAALHRIQRFSDFIETNVQHIKGVALIASTGQTIVQSDPWRDSTTSDTILSNSILSTKEGGVMLGEVLIAQESAVIKAAQDCFSRVGASSLAARPLVNADVVFGTGASAMYYLREMKDVLAARTRSKCMRNVRPDVAAHNWLVYEVGIEQTLKFTMVTASIESSPIISAQYSMPTILDGRGFLLRKEDYENPPMTGPVDPPSIITQYLSHPGLLQHIIATYQYGTAKKLEFVQRSGFTGKKLIRLPETWFNQPQQQQMYDNSEGMEAIDDDDDGGAQEAQEEEEQRGIQEVPDAEVVVLDKVNGGGEERQQQLQQLRHVGGGEKSSGSDSDAAQQQEPATSATTTSAGVMSSGPGKKGVGRKRAHIDTSKPIATGSGFVVTPRRVRNMRIRVVTAM